MEIEKLEGDLARHLVTEDRKAFKLLPVSTTLSKGSAKTSKKEELMRRPCKSSSECRHVLWIRGRACRDVKESARLGEIWTQAQYGSHSVGEECIHLIHTSPSSAWMVYDVRLESVKSVEACFVTCD